MPEFFVNSVFEKRFDILQDLIVKFKGRHFILNMTMQKMAFITICALNNDKRNPQLILEHFEQMQRIDPVTYMF